MSSKVIALALLATGWTISASAQPSPFEELYLEVSADKEGKLTISQDEFRLSKNEYYRFNLICMDCANGDSFEFRSEPLLSNSHLRVVSVEEQEVHMQGLSFHSLQCDGAGTIRFSFYPIRPGSFEFTVQSDDEPTDTVKGTFVVE